MSAVATNPSSNLETSGLSSSALEAIEKRTREVGREIYSGLKQSKPWFFQRKYWDDRIMDWSMRDEDLKVQLFRFVDVLPMLNSRDAIAGHLAEYLGNVGSQLPWALRAGLAAGRSSGVAKAVQARVARIGAADFARKFIAGTNTEEVVAAAKRARDLNRCFTLDILGEAVISKVEAERYFQAYVDLLEGVSPMVNSWPEVERLDRDMDGPIPRVNLSVKLSALDCHFDPIDGDGVTRRVGSRLRELLRVAQANRAFINIDMESYQKKDLTLRIFKEVLMEPEFRDLSDVGIVIQCYLTDSGKDFVELRDWAAQRGTPVWVRLVKGAYWDYETIHSKAEGWPIPVYQEKWHSDANFERQVRFVMQNRQHLRPAFGSHNLRSLAHAIAVAEHLSIPKNGYEIQMLYGMADAEKRSLIDQGHRMRIYMPYGELIPGMAYLVRRLLENTSNDSFLRAGMNQDITVDHLMSSPGSNEERSRTATSVDESRTSANGEPTENETKTVSDSSSGHPDMSNPQQDSKRMRSEFRNEPPVDFSLEKNRHAMQQALIDVEQQLGREFPLIIGGESVHTSDKIRSENPANTAQVVGVASSANADHVEQAVAAAREAFNDWAHMPVEKRVEYLRKTAKILRERLFELASWEVYECGKPWREATADIDEAVDFLEYYSTHAIRLQSPEGADVPGEENRFEFQPRGVVAVISPWNFPIAILCGMTAGALATGNTVIMKPAEQSPVTAALLMEAFQQAGLPAGVVNYLPGDGERCGAKLVEHPDVAVISFTGSRAVGLAINATAAQVSASGIPFVKKVIAEMGGKNAIIVDEDADLDEAVAGVTYSAFGFQGQKCSACSRVLVLDAVYDQFVERLVESARSQVVAPPVDPACNVGPVVDGEALARVKQYIEIGRQEGREILSVDVGDLAQQGHFVGPHIFADIAPDARLAQEEVFGPVLAVIRVKDLDEAFRVANGTDYALTGGIFSRSPSHLDRARREMAVGNLYLNRSCTGALVGRQPFGGFKMSGIGNKAGARDYLLQFVLPRTVTENTMRRGFAPMDE